MDMPPSRYKVVEKGRRLIVVDRLTGEQVRHQIHETPHRPDQNYQPPARAPDPAQRSQPAGPGRRFTTEPWYDNKGPRTLVLGDDALAPVLIVGGVLVAMGLLAFYFIGFVALFVAAFFVFQKGSRAALRRGVTGWLDGLERA